MCTTVHAPLPWLTEMKASTRVQTPHAAKRLSHGQVHGWHPWRCVSRRTKHAIPIESISRVERCVRHGRGRRKGSQPAAPDFYVLQVEFHLPTPRARVDECRLHGSPGRVIASLPPRPGWFVFSQGGGDSKFYIYNLRLLTYRYNLK